MSMIQKQKDKVICPLLKALCAVKKWKEDILKN